MAKRFVIVPERAKRPVKSSTLEKLVSINEEPIKRVAIKLVIKLLLIFKIYPLFKSEIILKGYHYVNNK